MRQFLCPSKSQVLIAGEKQTSALNGKSMRTRKHASDAAMENDKLRSTPHSGRRPQSSECFRLLEAPARWGRGTNRKRTVHICGNRWKCKWKAGVSPNRLFSVSELCSLKSELDNIAKNLMKGEYSGKYYWPAA